MTGEDVRKMTSEEIALEIKRVSEKLYTLRSQAVTEKVEDLSQFGKLKKDIARLRTEESARRIKAAGGDSAKAPGAHKAPRKSVSKSGSPHATRAAHAHPHHPKKKKTVTHARKTHAGPKNPRKSSGSARTSKTGKSKAKSAK